MKIEEISRSLLKKARTAQAAHKTKHWHERTHIVRFYKLICACKLNGYASCM